MVLISILAKFELSANSARVDEGKRVTMGLARVWRSKLVYLACKTLMVSTFSANLEHRQVQPDDKQL